MGQRDIAQHAWQAADPNGVSSININYSSDGGATWFTAATAQANDGTYDWVAPNIASNNFKIKIIAMDNNDNSSSAVSNQFSVKLTNNPPTVPYSPVPISNAQINDSTVTLQWECNDIDNDTLTYNVYFGTNSAPLLVSSAQTAKSYRTVLAANTAYYWQVVASDGKNTVNGPAWSFTTSEVVNAPINLSAIHVSASEVTLSWIDNSSNEYGFKIERKSGTNGTYAEIVSLEANVSSYTDTGLWGHREYIYRIRAYKGDVYSEYSNEAGAVTANNFPGQPVLVSPSDKVPGQPVSIILSWSGSDSDSDNIRYDVYFGTTTSPPRVSTAQAETSYSATSLSYGKIYYWKVVAKDPFNATSESPLWSFVTEPPPIPDAPANVTASIPSFTTVDLHWADNADNELGFIVERKQGIDGAYVQIAVTTAPSYSDTTVILGNVYYYRVKAYNSSGDSVYSNVVGYAPVSLDIQSPVTAALPQGGSFSSIQSIVLACSDGNGSGCATTYFTTDGSSPTTDSMVYSGAIPISANTTLKFFSVDNAGNAEPVQTEVYALFNTLTVNKAGTGSGTINVDVGTINWSGNTGSGAYINDSSVTLSAIPDTGSTFIDWNGCTSVNGNICMVTLNSSNKTCTATFSLQPPATFPLTVTKEGAGNGTVTSSPAGINCGADCQESYASGTVVTLTAAADAGFTFKGWSEDADCSDGQVTMNADKTCTATFAIDTHTITATAGDNGSISPSGSVTVNHGASQTFTIIPAANYHVADVKVDGSSIGAVTTYTFPNVTAAHTIEATFDILPAVTISAAGATATEAGSTVGTFTVSRTGTTAAAWTVNYTVGGTATAGSDYSALSGSVTITAGSATATLTVTPIDDTLVEGDETVIATLAANAAYTVGTPGSATVTIKDNNTTSNVFIIQPGPEGKDTTYGTVNYTNGAPDIENHPIGGLGDWYYNFFEFDLTGSPPAADTVSATLYLYGNAPSDGNDPGFQVYRITESWTESGVNFTNNPASEFYKNFGPFAVSSEPTWNKVDITDLYKDLKNGVYPNYGIKLVPTNNNHSNGTIASSDNINSAIRPKLEIVHTRVSPTTLLSLNQTSFRPGDPLRLELHLLTPAEVPPGGAYPVEAKLWLKTSLSFPWDLIPILNIAGPGQAVALPPGIDQTGPFLNLTIPADMPAGSYEFGLRLRHPTTGQELSVSLVSFEVLSAAASSKMRRLQPKALQRLAAAVRKSLKLPRVFSAQMPRPLDKTPLHQGFGAVRKGRAKGSLGPLLHQKAGVISVVAQPAAHLSLNGASFRVGDPLQLDVQLLMPTEIPSARSYAFEFKLWIKTSLPFPWDLIPILNIAGPGQAVSLPPGFDQTFRVIDVAVHGDIGTGAYEFGVRLLHPVTGEELSLDGEPFNVME